MQTSITAKMKEGLPVTIETTPAVGPNWRDDDAFRSHYRSQGYVTAHYIPRSQGYVQYGALAELCPREVKGMPVHHLRPVRGSAEEARHASARD